jgi:WD repeat-containing protein 68
VRILDVRQPGQALLELRGHSGSINAVEWSPNRRGVLATGADDSMVLVWDLLNASNGAALPALDNGAATAPPQATPATTAAGGAAAQGQPPQQVGAKGPANWWRCDYEVGNLSWAPQSGGGGDLLGISGGRGIWSARL